MTKTAANTVITKYAALLESEEFAVFALSPGYVGTTDTAVQPDGTGNAALDDMLENMCDLYPGYDPSLLACCKVDTDRYTAGGSL
ncbi:hypothetical protein IEO21_05364 [Rhodonia placenta]|uniref:Uncharacterized protein n=1 Tax=Rhodonia placenta TaxID=104341 RepID=A0A8H7P233_9APHY|nr:hypothetical protein IEO21_05364 [Postia placenta]